MSNEKWKEESELKDNTCRALLLQFKEPKVYDLSIPDTNEIYFLVDTGVKILNGKNPNEKSDYRSVIENPLKEEFFSLFSPRVSNGLLKILTESERNREFPLRFYMSNTHQILASEWNIGAGTWFRFREGKREETEKEVQDYFNKHELTDFDKLGNAFKPYVGMLNSINYSK